MNARTGQLARLIVGGALLMTSLSSCWRWFNPPQPPKSVTLNFQFPTLSAEEAKTAFLAAYYHDSPTTIKVLQQQPIGAYSYSNPNYPSTGGPLSSATLSLYGFETILNADTKCSTPFVGGETKDRSKVVVTPDNVNTCNVYFAVYSNIGANKPDGSNQLYRTNDFYGNATSDFTYSMTSPDGKSSESGTRKLGWSLVRHTVLEPSSAPGTYLVTQNSAPDSDLALPVRLHVPTNGLISMNLPTGSRK
jgi:hypothetical protein